MSAPAFTVSPQRFGAEVMLEMLDRDIRHVPVVWPHGEVVGVLTDRDLVIAETRAPFSLRTAIGEAENSAQLGRAAAQLRPAVVALHDSGLPPPQIAAMIAVVADALTRRLLELTTADLGAPPCPLALIALGSLGRREVVPSSDFDSALVWDGSEDDSEQSQYMQELGARVVGELAAHGFAADSHGATAAAPLFDRSFESWRRAIRRTVEHTDEENALVYISLLLDGRIVHGIGGGPDPLEELRQVWHREAILRLMLRLALAHKPPTGFLRFRDPPRDVVVEHEGRHRGELDIKKTGLLPIVSIARYGGLAAGVRALSTRERLDAAAIAGTLTGQQVATLKEAHEFFWRLRLDHQVEELREGREPDDYIDPRALDSQTRHYARDAFRAVRAVQRSLEAGLFYTS